MLWKSLSTELYQRIKNQSYLSPHNTLKFLKIHGFRHALFAHHPSPAFPHRIRRLCSRSQSCATIGSQQGVIFTLFFIICHADRKVFVEDFWNDSNKLQLFSAVGNGLMVRGKHQQKCLDQQSCLQLYQFCPGFKQSDRKYVLKLQLLTA